MGETDVVLIQSRPVPYRRFLAPAILMFTIGSIILLTPLGRDGGLVLGVVCLAGGALQTLPWIWLIVRSRRYAWAVRIGPDGVTWSDGPVHLPWPDVAELRVVNSRRKPWSFSIPGVRIVDRAEADWAGRASSRPSGYAIDIRQVQATSESVLAAISRFARVPVVYE